MFIENILKPYFYVCKMVYSRYSFGNLLNKYLKKYKAFYISQGFCTGLTSKTEIVKTTQNSKKNDNLELDFWFQHSIENFGGLLDD